ncbi:MAG: hypothetical protein H0T62_09255 [Parachlamydiaceae bacterium]|nr:hypothetical protein [Parachlamydiaceae bacterium]
MRKTSYTCLYLGTFSLACGALFADDDIDTSLQNVGSEQMIDKTFSEQYPFRVSAQGDWIGRSKIDKRKHHNQHVDFHVASAQVEGVFYYDPHCDEGLGGAIGYGTTYFHWKENPYFRVKNINELSVTVSAFSQRITGWLWQSHVTANWQTKYHDISEYTNYDIVLWGRYELKKCFHMHIGFFAQTGMKIDHILPIFGFDYTINEKWQINAIFPLNVSIVYAINDCWSASLAGRLFNIRYRVGKHENESKGLMQYRNKGAEFALNYNKDRYSANIHAGMTFGGQFKISNRNNKHKHHFDIGSAAYAGGELAVKF